MHPINTPENSLKKLSLANLSGLSINRRNISIIYPTIKISLDLK